MLRQMRRVLVWRRGALRFMEEKCSLALFGARWLSLAA